MPAVATPDSAAFLSQLQPGQKLAGCYLLQKLLVARGPRVIWLAHDEVLGKDVALHFLPVELLGRPGVAERLRQEVKRNRQRIHPSILRVYDFIEEDEWAAISTDAFAGATLGAQLAGRDGGCFEVDEIAPWITALGRTLEDAHRIRLVHGALTPDDVVLEAEGKVRVMNFGIGAVLRETGEDPTATAFASPQQLTGESPTPSDDVFALGAITHALLAGEPPFTGTQRGEARTVALHRRVRQCQGAEVPAGWQQAITAALAVEAAARPASVAEFLQKVQAESAPAPVVEKAPESRSAPVISAPEAPAPVVPAAPKPEPAAEVKRADAVPPVASVEGSAKTEPEPTEKAATQAKAAEPENPKMAPKPAPVDAEALAETVRREEAAAEASKYRYADDEEDGYVGSRASGGRGMALPVIGGAVGLLVIFAVIKLLVGEPKRPVTISSSTPAPTVANPEPTPSPVKPVREPEKPAVASNAPSLAETKPAPTAATPAPVVTETKPATPSPSPAKEPIAEKSPAALAAEDAEALTKQQQELEAKVAAAKKELEEKTKALPAMQKAAAEALAQEKKREEEAVKAEQAAQLAIQVAEEKKKLAEAARQAVITLTEQGRAKKEEHTKTVELVSSLQKSVQDDEKALADVRKAALEAVKRREAEAKKMLDAQSAQAAQAAAEKAEAERKANEMAEAQRKEKEAAEIKAREEAMAQAREAEKPKVQDELAKAREQFEKQAKALEEAIKSAKPVPPTESPLRLNDSGAAKTEGPGQGELALNKTPAKEPELPRTTEAGDRPAPSGASGEFMNSLGMKFVPLGGNETLIAIWPTRVRDFEVFAKTTGLKSTLWKDPGFKQGSDHPVVNVTWQEATAFCKWLTVKERAEGLLAPGQSYRLPTDLEWSRAVGLPAEKGSTPEQRDMGVPDVYPWGSAWPPPPNSGNYTGEETGSDVAIKGYDDGFPWTSPVGSFPPNQLGLYDMGGNVWQWCQDSWNNESKAKVLRGASWYNGALKLSLLSSCRVHAAPDSGTDNYGFRVVLATEAGKSARR
jgi:serine/threonine protein kinase